MRNYGLPYQGSKNQIAEEIIDFLPQGNRLVDLFGGGGAISHCASLSGKWKSILYNEYNPLVVKAFIMAINGEFDNDNRWIDRDEFNRLKDSDPYVAFAFSFSNNLLSYAYSDDSVELKKALFYARSFHDFSYLKKLGIDCGGSLSKLRRMVDFRQQSVEAINRLRSIGKEHLTGIEIMNGSYLDYDYSEGDVVYCDPPYENTSCGSYSGFDSQQFYDWVDSRDYQVFFSSYEISDDRFYIVFQTKKIELTSNLRGIKTEYIYSNKPYQKNNLIRKYFTFG